MKKVCTIIGLKRKPKVGDRVSVCVGFESIPSKGTVASIHEDFCWIDQYNSDGKYTRSFTASFSYCVFHFLN